MRQAGFRIGDPHFGISLMIAYYGAGRDKDVALGRVRWCGDAQDAFSSGHYRMFRAGIEFNGQGERAQGWQGARADTVKLSLKLKAAQGRENTFEFLEIIPPGKQ